MQKKILMLPLLFCLLLSSSILAPQPLRQNSGYTIESDRDYDFNTIDSKYFISGYLFDSTCSIEGNIIKKTNVTDALCFYKIAGEEKFRRLTSDISMIDVTNKKYFFNKIIPESFGNDLTEKILNIDNRFYYYDYEIKEKLTRSNFLYNERNNTESGLPNFSYYISFQSERRIWKGAGLSPGSCIALPFLIAYDSSRKHKYVSEIIYIENHRKNFEITDIKIGHPEKIGKKSDFDEFTWDFIKGKKMNTLIVKVKMNKKPLGDIYSDTVSFKVTGIINK